MSASFDPPSLDNGPSEKDPPREPPFQFGVRAMLIGVSALCAMLGVMAYLDAVWSVVLAWAALLVGAHVAGNAWGSNSRHFGRRFETREAPLQRVNPQPIEYAPATRLRGNTRIGLVMILACLCGATTCGVAASLLLAHARLERVGELGIAIVGLSAAVLGGYLGFLAASFTQVFGRAFREASREPHRPKPR